MGRRRRGQEYEGGGLGGRSSLNGPFNLENYVALHVSNFQDIEKELTKAFDECRVMQDSLACAEREKDETQEKLKRAEEKLNKLSGIFFNIL